MHWARTQMLIFGVHFRPLDRVVSCCNSVEVSSAITTVYVDIQIASSNNTEFKVLRLQALYFLKIQLLYKAGILKNTFFIKAQKEHSV